MTNTTTDNFDFAASTNSNGFKPAIKAAAIAIGGELTGEYVSTKSYPSKFGGEMHYVTIARMASVNGKLVYIDDNEAECGRQESIVDIALNNGAKMAIEFGKLVAGDVFKLRRGEDKLKVGNAIYSKVAGVYQDKQGAKMPELAIDESTVFYTKKVGFQVKTFFIEGDKPATDKDVAEFKKTQAGKLTARNLPSYVVLKGTRKGA